MKMSELPAVLTERRISPRAVSIDGASDDEEQYRNKKDGILWAVYYYERGQARGLREFLTEEEACRHLLDILERDMTTHFRGS